MDKDGSKKICLSDNERYADLINGLLLQGEQKIKAEDLQEIDSQSFLKVQIHKKRGQYRQRYRDLIKKTALGVNFILFGIENQEQVHYLMPLRVMEYDVAEYEKQAIQIQKKNRKIKRLRNAEFLSGFCKKDRLYPCITMVLYYGEKPWDGSKDLHGLLDFTDIPEKLKKYINNYYIYVFEIAKFDKTEIFKTDIKQIFDFIRYSKDKNKLKELVLNDKAYQAMEADAYDMIVACTKAEAELGMKKFQEKDGKINMCKGLKEWAKEERELGRKEGIEQGIEQGIQAFVEDNVEEGVITERIINKLVFRFQLSEEKAKEYVDKFKMV